MIRKITFFSLIVIIGFLISCTPETFNNYCSVSGVVVEEGTNELLQGVIVTLKGVEQRNEITGADGTFLFQNLNVGASTKLDIWAQKDGYETNHVTVAAVSGETQNTVIRLKKINN